MTLAHVPSRGCYHAMWMHNNVVEPTAHCEHTVCTTAPNLAIMSSLLAIEIAVAYH